MRDRRRHDPSVAAAAAYAATAVVMAAILGFAVAGMVPAVAVCGAAP